MSERTCIAVDSACDLPAAIFKEQDLQILPITLKLGGNNFIDNRDPEKTIQFYLSDMGKKSFDAETEPFSVKEMSSLLEEKLIFEYDEVLAITINSARSEIYKNVRDAVFVSQHKFKEARTKAGLSPFFKIRVFDSGTLFTGQGVLVYEALRLLKAQQLNISQVVEKLVPLKDKVRAFLLPKDLYHLKNRASKKGDDSVGWLSYQMGNMLNVKPIIQCYKGHTEPVDKVMGFNKGLVNLFEKTKSAIENKLSINVVVMSYAGDLNDIYTRSDYRKFVTYAKSKNVRTLMSIMSTTASVNVGPGSFSLAYAEA
ncbi:MAG: DegV family protein [Gammaproteobacteria bacterium]|nr:DegV family protein [Gammaproteobacteria bacterium]